MNLLLDTHALLWWLEDNPALGQTARRAIADPGHLVFMSAISIWEIVIQRALDMLDVPDELCYFCVPEGGIGLEP